MDMKMYGWIALFFLAFVWIFKHCNNYFRSVVLALRLPGPRALPLLGNVLTIKNYEAMWKIGDNVSQFYVPLVRLWVFFVPIILVYQPDHLKLILSNTKVSEKNFFYTIMHTFIGSGLIVSTGNQWKKNRRLIQPYFQTNLLANYYEYFAEASKSMVKTLAEDKCIQITSVVNACILKILHKSILGIDLNMEHETPFRRSPLFVIKRVLRPWLLFDSIFKRSSMAQEETNHSNELHQYVKKVLDEKLAKRKMSNHLNSCLLDDLIELSERYDFPEEDIINETVAFMLAGHDSVASAVVFCLYHLAKHQIVQQKVYKEINETMSNNGSDKIHIEQVNQMHYLKQCIKETLRLTPSLPLISRVLTADVTLDKYIIPAGTNIFISPFATHRLPHIFPDPLKFDPDRFSEEHIKKIHPFGFLPFSIGPRNCIGYKFAYLEMKTLIASIVKDYHITLRQPNEELQLGYKITLRVKGGIWMKFTTRKKKYLD